MVDTSVFGGDERKYRVDDAGVAEMCNVFCKRLGRGHIHLGTDFLFSRCPFPLICFETIIIEQNYANMLWRKKVVLKKLEEDMNIKNINQNLINQKMK